MTKSKIEWTDEVWNPITGCTKVSQGCKHCYAETIASRFWATQYPPNEDGSPRRFKDVRLHPERLEDPLKWRKPRRVFVNSMSDLFHEGVPFFFIAKVFATMALLEKHTFMVLTKRPHRMEEFITLKQNWTMIQNICETWADNPPEYDKYLPNVWLGVSVEDQTTADERIPILLQTPAAVRFVSYEPALGPVDFQVATWFHNPHESKHNLPPNGIGLDWIIMGGESGPGARPMNPDWARSVVQQCSMAGVPVFVKQMGSVWAKENAAHSKGGDINEFPTDLRIREFPSIHSSGQEL